MATSASASSSLVVVLSVVRIINSQLAAHEFVLIQVSYSCCCLICVCIFCETKTLWFACLFVVNQTEVVNLTNALQCLCDNIFGNTFGMSARRANRHL